jgi:hypothetical protein
LPFSTSVLSLVLLNDENAVSVAEKYADINISAHMMATYKGTFMMFFCFTPVNYIKIFWFTYRDQNAKRRTYPVLYGASVPYYVIGNKIKVLVVKRIISIFVATVATHFSFSFRFDSRISHLCDIE